MTTDTASRPSDTTSFPKHLINVVLLEGIHPEAKEIFERDGFNVRLESGALDGGALHEAIADAHMIGIRSKTHLTAEVLEHARRLIAVGCFCIGTNQVDLPAAAVRGVPVFNSPFSNTRSVAELVIAEVVALHRQLFDRSAAAHRGEWQKSAKGAHEIRGRTLGIVGYGHIGTQVSILAEAMGMRVQFFDLASKLPLGNAVAVGSLDELLETSDVVTLHVPATPLTRMMIGPEQIAQMRDGAMLINNARGTVVDVAALADAIRSGRIAGAAIDVFPEEPATNRQTFTTELAGLPNVILTPHIGGSTQEAQANIARDAAGKLLRFMNVGSTTGAVNVPQVELPPQPAAPGAEPRMHRILHFHRNAPGVLGRLNGALSARGVNVSGQYLQTDERLGYVVLDIDPTDVDTAALEAELREIPETVRTRMLW